ncbi:MAG: hydrogenase maturation protease [candidate division NC10 bacterium]|nr:hydrogenase maturation protease [candidate division NC10 bacterium]
MDLAEDLRRRLVGRVAVVGIGNPDLGDDGAGMRLAERLAARGLPDVILAERTPERWLPRLARVGYDGVLFLDAVEAGAHPGSVLLLDGAEAESRFPQLSTHKLSLGTLARLLEAEGGARVLLLGIQPARLAPGGGLSAPVEMTVEILADLLSNLRRAGTPAMAVCGEHP